MVIYYNPTTPSRRGLALIDRSSLWKGKPMKSLVKGRAKTGGRNNHGCITTRHIGGRCKRKLRNVMLKPSQLLHDNKTDTLKCYVVRIEHDPFRNAFIALCYYNTKEKQNHFYIIATEGLKADDEFEISTQKLSYYNGIVLPIMHIPVGTTVCCVETRFNGGMQVSRAAGTYSTVIGKDESNAIIKMGNGRRMTVPLNCFAIVGTVSNADFRNQVIAKAGRNRWKGIRPTVRGAVMNPVDHPHGGGEGKSKSGRQPCTPWGKLTKGKKTRYNIRNKK